MEPEYGSGFAVVRVKPLGAGAGGGERSALEDGAVAAVSIVRDKVVHVDTEKGRKRDFDYPLNVVSPDESQDKVYEKFMPSRVADFLSGVNVNVMCYGQTGSGKTHTMFGPPGMMLKASSGRYGMGVGEDYGICPRGIIDIMNRVEQLKRQSDSTRYKLTASAVELRFIEGNRDMLRGDKQMFVKIRPWQSMSDVQICSATKPPILLGQREMDLNSQEPLMELFRAISTRSTRGTGMNDSSSRSHCFVYLNLYAYDLSSNLLRRSRFQFVDLAGSERMEEAHGAKNWKECGEDALQGLCVNYGLMLLSQRLRELSAARRKSQKARLQQSSKTQLDPDELLLLAESMSGDANSLIIVCVSSAVPNATQSINALDFGSEFAKLTMKPRIAKSRTPKAWRKDAAEWMAAGASHHAGGSSKYALRRQSMGRAGMQLNEILESILGESSKEEKKSSPHRSVKTNTNKNKKK